MDNNTQQQPGQGNRDLDWNKDQSNRDQGTKDQGTSREQGDRDQNNPGQNRDQNPGKESDRDPSRQSNDVVVGKQADSTEDEEFEDEEEGGTESTDMNTDTE